MIEVTGVVRSTYTTALWCSGNSSGIAAALPSELPAR